MQRQTLYCSSYSSITMKKVVKEAMQKAKELEKLPEPRKEDILKIYKDGIEQAKKLGKLLKPQPWLIDEKKCVHPATKVPLPTRPKKKTL